MERQQLRGRKALGSLRLNQALGCVNLYLTYSNSICLLILACHRAVVGNHLVASFQTAPLPTVAT